MVFPARRFQLMSDISWQQTALRVLCVCKFGIAASGAEGGVAGQGLPVMKGKSVVVKGIPLKYAHAFHPCVISSDSNFVRLEVC